MASNNSTATEQPQVLFKSCRDWSSVFQIVLTAIIMVMSIIGNGAICSLLVRFRSLRTVPNILVANLAFIDVINAISNMPLFIMWYQCQVRFLTGPTVSWCIIAWYVFFMYLTATSLVVLMLDRYGAIVHGLKYHTWKTRNKAVVAVLVIWLTALSYTLGMFSLGLNINVGEMPVWIYRIHYFKKFGRSFLIPGYLVPFAIIVLLGFLIWRKVRMSTRAIASQINMGRRVKSEVQTAKTLGITILAYFWMGCFPVLLHSIARLHGSWVHYFGYFFMFMNSMANPVIYSLRTRRFRAAFMLLLRDPCGISQPTDKRLNSIKSSIVTMEFSKTTHTVFENDNKVF